MLKDRAIRFYNSDYNCSQCIIKAANEKYGLNLPDECVKMCIGVNNGLGIGSVCSVLMACVMILSVMFPDDIKRKRMAMINEFVCQNGSVNCGKIMKSNCCDIIESSCDILEKIIG